MFFRSVITLGLLAGLGLGAPTSVQTSSGLLSFTASDAFLIDPASVIGPLGKAYSRTSATQSVYYGSGIEDPNAGYVFLGAVALADVDLQVSLTPLLAVETDLSTLHIQFESGAPLDAIFTAGETEMTHVTIKPESSEDEVLPLLLELVDAITGVDGGVAAAVGKLDVEGTLELVAGWESLEAHLAAISTPELGAIIGQLLAVVDIVPANAVFQKL